MKKYYIYLILFICIFSVALNMLIVDKSQKRLPEISVAKNWVFAEKQLIIHDADLSNENRQKIVSLPLDFKDISDSTSNYGTFLTQIELPEKYKNQTLALKIPTTYSAYKVFINGEEVANVGTVASTREQHQTDIKQKVISFKTANTKLAIAIQVSSFEEFRGGISAAPIIGDWDLINDDAQTEILIIVFTAGIIFIASITTLFIGLLNSSEKELLIFSIYTLLISIRAFFVTPYIFHYFPFNIPFYIAIKIGFIVSYLAFIFYFLFIFLKFKEFFSKKVLLLIFSLFSLLIIITLTTKPYVFEALFFYLLPIKLLIIFYLIYVTVKASKSGDTLAKLLSLGIFLVIFAMIIDHLTAIGFFEFPPVGSLSIAFNIFLVIFSLSKNYVQQVQDLTVLNYKLHEVNINLDEKIQQRTQLLHEANLQLSHIASYDSLTGIFNRRSF